MIKYVLFYSIYVRKSLTTPEEILNFKNSSIFITYMPTILKVSNISKKFGAYQVLKDINLEIKEGEIYGIMGMSGGGKSTLLNIVTDLLKPDSGVIQFKLGDKFHNLSEKPYDIKKLFGYSFQDPSFHSMLTVEENLEHFATLYGLPTKFGTENTKTLLKLVELDKASKTLGQDLSGGMQKRLCFACALVHSPKILFLDEPTSNLDPVLRKEAWELLMKINQNGTTIVIASQLLSELETYCDRVCILHGGKIIKEGTVDQIKKDHAYNIEINIETLPGNYDRMVKELKAKKLKIPKVDNQGHRLVLGTPDPEAVLHNLLHIIKKNKENLVDMSMSSPSLSEVFESLVK